METMSKSNNIQHNTDNTKDVLNTSECSIFNWRRESTLKWKYFAISSVELPNYFHRIFLFFLVVNVCPFLYMSIYTFKKKIPSSPEDLFLFLALPCNLPDEIQFIYRGFSLIGAWSLFPSISTSPLWWNGLE